MTTKAMKFNTKEEAQSYADENCSYCSPMYESGYYEAVTGLAKGWYLYVAPNRLWQEAA